METRCFTATIDLNGVRTEPLMLDVHLTRNGRLTAGEGTFALPARLVGAAVDGTAEATVETEEGESFRIMIDSFDVLTGLAHFVTRSPVPELRRRA